MEFNEVKGDLIKLALSGEFDVIAHGCNCFCTMGAGIAPYMAKAFGCNKYPMERESHCGDINKLGTIDWCAKNLHRIDTDPIGELMVVNAYTQFNLGSNHKEGILHPVDYEAITLCMRKINKIFKGKHIGLPLIGCGLAGGDWNIVKQIFQDELKDCDVTIVHFNS